MSRAAGRGLPETALVAESFLRLTTAVVLISCFPFRRLAPMLGNIRAESPIVITDAMERSAKQTAWAIGVARRRLPFEYSCLAQALAAKGMLRRRGIASTLYLGVDPHAGDPFRAHAWLRCGSIVVTGGPGHEAFAPIATFAESAATPSEGPG